MPITASTLVRHFNQDLELPRNVREKVRYALSYASKYWDVTYRHMTFGAHIDMDDLWQELLIALVVADSEYDPHYIDLKKPWPHNAVETQDAQIALSGLVETLEDTGWEQLETLPSPWYQLKFKRLVEKTSRKEMCMIRVGCVDDAHAYFFAETLKSRLYPETMVLAYSRGHFLNSGTYAPFAPFLRKCLRNRLNELYRWHSARAIKQEPIETTIVRFEDAYTGAGGENETLEDKLASATEKVDEMLAITAFARTLTPIQQAIVEFLHSVDFDATDIEIAKAFAIDDLLKSRFLSEKYLKRENWLSNFQRRIHREREKIMRTVPEYVNTEAPEWQWFLKHMQPDLPQYAESLEDADV